MEMSNLSLQIPIIGVVGRKNTGKTMIIEILVRKLVENNYRVATAKHVNEKNFSMDTKGKDTWKHAKAGANPVISVSNMETSILMKDGFKDLSPEKIASLTSDVDLIFLEGFSKKTLSNKKIGKIVCVKDHKEYAEYKKQIKGNVLCFCSIKPMKRSIFRIREDSEIIMERVKEYVKKQIEILGILKKLPRFDCEKCGYSSCYDAAVAIYNGRIKLSDCPPLSVTQGKKTRITVHGIEIPIQPFVSEIIQSSIIGMISTLKGVSIRGNESLNLELT
jgi:molybdopterin-guanine dinucleotide biosynthesis protein B